MKFTLVLYNGETCYHNLDIIDALLNANELVAEHGDLPLGLFSEETGAEVTKFKIAGDPREHSLTDLMELVYRKPIELISCS